MTLIVHSLYAKRGSIVRSEALPIHLVVDRRSEISPWGLGNGKLGPGVYTYDRLPGHTVTGGTCPGSTQDCESVCYAKRLVSNRPIWDLLRENTAREEVPELPEGAKLVRIHVSGDFDTKSYIRSWIRLVRRNPDVRFWGYTRSWRVAELLPYLEYLRQEDNVQLFASVDSPIEATEILPEGWRWAKIAPSVESVWPDEGYICPEETGRKAACTDCNYCIKGRRGDVVFIEH